MTDVFEDREVVKDIILVFDSSNGLNINYHVTEEHEVYVISNYKPFESYISELINRGTKKLSVFVIFDDLYKFFTLLKFLYKFDKFKSYYADTFLDDYKFYISHLNEPNTTNENINILLKKSQCDKPLSFNLFVLLNSARFLDYNSSFNILIQQYVRFVTMKHGGTLIATQELDLVVPHLDDILKIDHDPQSTFNEEMAFRLKDITVTLYIPRGWDSRNMITILGKSIIPGDDRKLFLEDKDFDNFELLYNNFLITEEDKAVPPVPDIQLHNHKSARKIAVPNPTTWQDFLLSAMD